MSPDLGFIVGVVPIARFSLLIRARHRRPSNELVLRTWKVQIMVRDVGCRG